MAPKVAGSSPAGHPTAKHESAREGRFVAPVATSTWLSEWVSAMTAELAFVALLLLAALVLVAGLED